MAGEIVFTRKARCRDCHRCLRACPVKAIRVHDGQAQVVADRCIACGTCIRECPQHAKAYRNDVAGAAALIAEQRWQVEYGPPGHAVIYDRTPAEVGAAAHAHNIELHELAPAGTSLELLFLQLTSR